MQCELTRTLRQSAKKRKETSENQAIEALRKLLALQDKNPKVKKCVCKLESHSSEKKGTQNPQTHTLL